MMLNLMAVLYIFRFFAKAATNHHKEHRHEEDRQDRRGHHPAHYACTDGIKFGFDVIKLTEISAVVRENHLASQKVLQKSGLRYVKEIHDVKDAPPSLLYSISVDEWLRNLEVNASV